MLYRYELMQTWKFSDRGDFVGRWKSLYTNTMHSVISKFEPMKRA